MMKTLITFFIVIILSTSAICSEEMIESSDRPIKVNIVNNFYQEKTILDAAFFKDPGSKTITGYELSLEILPINEQNATTLFIPYSPIKAAVFVLRYPDEDGLKDKDKWRKLRRQRTMLAFKSIKFKYPTRRDIAIQINDKMITCELVKPPHTISTTSKRQRTEKVASREDLKKKPVKRLKKDACEKEQD